MSRKIRGPGGSNEMINPPDPTSPKDWEDFTGVYAQNKRDTFMQGGKPSTANRKSRPCSGPARSGIRSGELDYEGT